MGNLLEVGYTFGVAAVKDNELAYSYADLRTCFCQGKSRHHVRAASESYIDHHNSSHWTRCTCPGLHAVHEPVHLHTCHQAFLPLAHPFLAEGDMTRCPKVNSTAALVNV